METPIRVTDDLLLLADATTTKLDASQALALAEQLARTAFRVMALEEAHRVDRIYGEAA